MEKESPPSSQALCVQAPRVQVQWIWAQYLDELVVDAAGHIDAVLISIGDDRVAHGPDTTQAPSNRSPPLIPIASAKSVPIQARRTAYPKRTQVDELTEKWTTLDEVGRAAMRVCRHNKVSV